MKRKTEEEKVEEYVNFFKKFCSGLTRRNEGYSFELKEEKFAGVCKKDDGYTYFISVTRKKDCGLFDHRMYPQHEGYFRETPKKAKLNSVRSLFRKIFSGKNILIYYFNASEDKCVSEDLVDRKEEYHNVTARFEKYKTPIEAEMKLTLLGFEFDQFNEGVFREQEGISRLFHS